LRSAVSFPRRHEILAQALTQITALCRHRSPRLEPILHEIYARFVRHISEFEVYVRLFLEEGPIPSSQKINLSRRESLSRLSWASSRRTWAVFASIRFALHLFVRLNNRDRNELPSFSVSTISRSGSAGDLRAPVSLRKTVFEAAAGRRLGDDPPGSCLGPHPRSDSRMYD